MNNEKHLFILRGLPGSGKSYLASVIAPEFNVAADDYFDVYNGGEFNPAYLRDAHNWCRGKVSEWVVAGKDRIAVHNTNTQTWEYEKYLNLGKEYGYNVHVIVVENHHGSESVHGVPTETIEKMRNRFEVKL